MIVLHRHVPVVVEVFVLQVGAGSSANDRPSPALANTPSGMAT
jgi:hypothetical protein